MPAASNKQLQKKKQEITEKISWFLTFMFLDWFVYAPILFHFLYCRMFRALQYDFCKNSIKVSRGFTPGVRNLADSRFFVRIAPDGPQVCKIQKNFVF